MDADSARYVATFPWLGPVLIRHRGRQPWLGLGADPQLGHPLHVCILPVHQAGDRWQIDRSVLNQTLQKPTPQVLRPCAGDWFNERIPRWARAYRVEFLAVLLLYPQARCIGRQINDPAAFFGGTQPSASPPLHHIPALPQAKTAAQPGALDFGLLERGDDLAGLKGGQGTLGGIGTVEGVPGSWPLGNIGTMPGAPGPSTFGNRGTPGKTPGPADDPRHVIAQRNAIYAAINGLKRSTDALPRGIVRLDWTKRRGLRLALGSCQYPPGIVNESPGFESWRRLGAAAKSTPDLLVLTGDQIYADATAGLFDPGELDDRYRKPHETWLRNRYVRDVVRRVPIVTMLDDHEIDDNWEPIALQCPEDDLKRNADFHREGIEAFLRFQRPPGRDRRQPPPTEPLWFRIRHHGVPVFVLDSRSDRERRSATAPGAAMFRPRQRAAWHAWLRDQDPALPKIVVSASALLPRHRRANVNPLAFGVPADSAAAAALRSDGWDGFPETFHETLALIADENIERLVFLSGDEHLGLYARATIAGPAGRKVVLHSVHSPGLNTPYRFANAYRADLLLDTDSFRFSRNGKTYTCVVETLALEGPGFVHVRLAPVTGGSWQLDVAFPGASLLPISL